MKQLAQDVYLLDGFPPFAINVYLIGDVLVDAGTRHAGKRILRQLKGRTITAHVLTHAHPDHQGASHEVCETLRIPLWCGERDADAMQDGRIMERQPKHPINRLIG
ncbi:MAG: MBL fold metallo-hydrolase [Actinomycetota bacterium]|nr:MBL fold metallo-hydrolase [Actinomycetota bacterium]